MEEPSTISFQQLLWSTADAEVFAATQLSDSKQLISKTVSSIATDPAKSLAHLQREYRITSELLNHYHLPTVAQDKTNGKPVFIYEYQPHRPLAIINRERRFSIAENLRLAIEINCALNTIHAQGIVHRNICSHSVLWDPGTQQARLTDFGLAHSLSRPDLHSNNELESDAGSIINNSTSADPAYMSPEMTGRINRTSDFRSDFYSLGILLYKQFTGNLPFPDNDMLSLVHSHLAIVPPTPKEQNPQLPEMISIIIMKLLEKTPESRYQSGQGLLADLDRCLKEYRDEHAIASFPIGGADVHEQFLIADKIYGRETQIQTLLKAWDETCEGHGQVIFIHGVAGSGKTRLTKELQRKVVTQGGIFITGKFEQNATGTPYFGLVRAFESLAQHILSQSDKQVEQWKTHIQNAISPNGKLLTDLAPQLELVLGPQDAIPELGVNESRNRFKQLFSPLFDAVATAEHPIVIMLDDLHWADPASLSLLEELAANSEQQHLMLLSCYRDEQVDSLHPLSVLRNALFDEAQNEKAPSTDIRLDSLQQQDIHQLILDTLHIPPGEDGAHCQKLSEHIFNNTQGNPFFVNQLLQQMYDDGLIAWDSSSACWQFSNLLLSDVHYATDIVEFLHQKITELPEPTRQLLQIAACLGNRFKLNDLDIISTNTDVARALEPALAIGLITATEQHYQFIHDRVQQANMASKSELSELYYHIARQLSASLPEEEQRERLFEFAHYWNAAQDKISTSDEIQTSIQLNQMAARKSNAANAYHSALEFAQRATHFFNEQSWEQTPEQTFNAYFELARTHFLDGSASQSRQLCEELLQRSKNIADDSRCYALLKDIITNQGSDYSLAVKLGCSILNKAGISIPQPSTNISKLIKDTEDQIEAQLLNSSHQEITTLLSSLPNNNHGEHKHKLRLLMDLWEAAYYAANTELMDLCAIRMIEQSLLHGNASESAFGYVLFSIHLSLRGDYSRAYEFGAFALQLNSTFNDRILLPKITNIFCNYTAYFKQPFAEITKLYQRSARHGKQNGDYLFGVWATFFSVWTEFLSGTPLPQVYQSTLKHQSFIEQCNDEKMQRAFRMLQSGLLHLMNKHAENDFLSSVGEELNQSLKYWQKEEFIPAQTWYSIFAGQVNYLTGKSAQALDDYSHYGQETSTAIVMFPMSQYDFYQCMAELDDIQHVKPDEQQRRIQHAKQVIEQLEPLAESCAENFAHQYWLLQAEKARVENNIEQASLHFGKALENIQSSDNLYVAALTNELTARFWLTQNNTGFAGQFMNRAYHLYLQWGAKNKTAQLMREHSALISDSSIKDLTHKNSSSPHTKSHQRTSSALKPNDIDLAAILQSAKMMMEETNITQLLESIVWICAEQTGAQRGVLVTSNKLLHVECVVESMPRRNATTAHISLDDSHAACHSIIRYAARTCTNIVLNNASKEGEYINDPYIKQHQIKSVLCVPFFHLDQVAGLIYLENNLTSSVFTEQRIETLRMLLGQVAILLQNARVHSALQQSEERMRLSHGYANIGSWDWDIISGELFWSETISAIFGYPNTILETSLENFNKAVHPDDLEMVVKATTDCIEHKVPYNIDHRIVWPDGTVRWMNEVGGIIRDNNDQPLRMIGIVRDITDAVNERDKQLITQKQLQQAQKMDAVGQLTGGIAHDFNNMLASILGYSELLQSVNNQQPNEKISKYLDEIITAGMRASTVVKQLLSFSRNETGKTSLIDLNQLVKETLRLLRATIPSSIELHEQIDSNAESILADPIQIQQVLMNLCLNARDASGEVGSITLTLSRAKNYRGVCASCLEPINGEYLSLSVTNSGEPIEPEVQRRMFDPFFTTKEVGKGSGMGLAMSHGILHSCDGHITVQSEVQNEAHSNTFSLLFPPYIDTSTQKNTTALPIKPAILLRAHIMVVDDERSIINLLTETLEMAGCTVDAFFDSDEALRRFEQSPADYDLVITDQTMPKLTGMELAKRMLEQRPELPIVLSTGYSATVDEETALTAGIKAYVEKPYSPDDFVAVVTKLLHPES